MDINNQGDDSQNVDAPIETSQVQEQPDATQPTEPAQGDEQKGASQRIRELSQQKKVAEERARSLEERVSELTRSDDAPYVPQIQPGEEITQERYQQDVTRSADSLVRLRMKQYEAESRIKSESTEAVKAHPQLDPNSKEFDRELSDTITEAVEAHIRVNPYSASVKKFVDKLMKPYTKAVEREIGEASAKVAKQVTETALRPTSVRKTEKNASEMSIAELEAKLGVVNS